MISLCFGLCRLQRVGGLIFGVKVFVVFGVQNDIKSYGPTTTTNCATVNALLILTFWLPFSLVLPDTF
jgi:hypothetical protein